MELQNFDVREIIFADGDDPKPGTAWRSWWDGGDPRVPHYLAHLLWWNFCEISEVLSQDVITEPDAAIESDGVMAHPAIDRIAREIQIRLDRLDEFHPIDEDGIGRPFEFERYAQDDELLKSDYSKAISIYALYCTDKALTGLKDGNAGISATAVAYVTVAVNILQWERQARYQEVTEKSVKSELGRNAADKRHEGTNAMRDEAIRLYKLRSDWASRRQAAKAIVTQVQKYAKDHSYRQLSVDRAEITVYEWLGTHDKNHNRANAYR